MLRLLIPPCLLLAVLAAAAPARGQPFMRGADVSFLPHAEAQGIVFRDAGQPKPGLQILRDHGYNWVRLRLFHTPTRLPNDLPYAIAAAQQARALGFKLLLNLHYSDTWADPAKQFIPRAWQDLEHPELVDAVFEYTRDVIAQMAAAGVLPDMVQVGNEVISGMLWPAGRLPQRWPQFAELVNAGIRGVDAGRGDGPRPAIMIHIDRGGDLPGTRHFFDRCREHGIEFDVIGQSYYPWWHGTLEQLRDNLALMIERYDKDVVLVEVAYNWRPAEYRDAPGPYPETPAGQRQFLRDVEAAVRAAPAGRGRGVFWWEPAVPPSPIASRALFDDQHHALPALSELHPPPAADPAAGQ